MVQRKGAEKHQGVGCVNRVEGQGIVTCVVRRLIKASRHARTAGYTDDEFGNHFRTFFCASRLAWVDKESVSCTEQKESLFSRYEV